MAHYVFIDENNIVTDVFAGVDEGTDGIDWEQWYSEFHNKRCLRTSVNTKGNKHAQNKEPFRKNYAGIGMTYDEQRDAFLFPKPFESWILDEETCFWKAPIEYPNDGGYYTWDEINQVWINIPTTSTE